MQLKHRFTEHAHCFLFSLSALLPCLLVTATTEYAPRNQVVVGGRNATLKCGWNGSNNLQWKHKQAGEEEISLTFNQNTSSNNVRKGLGLMLNTSIDGQYDLHITNVSRSDAGSYICIETKNSTAGSGSLVTKRYEAQMTILTSDPNCTLNTNTSSNTLAEGDYVRMQCNFRFVGDLVPLMNWRREGQLIDGSETNISKTHWTNQMTVTSSVLSQVNSMDNGVRFSCNTSFTTNVYNNSSDDTHHSIKATNNPDYEYTWISPPINVSYGPQNLTIQLNNMSGDEDIIILGDHLKCFADGNPTPRYEWTIFAEDSNITLNSSEFALNASMLSNFQLTAECKAVNEFGERTKIFARVVSGVGDTCTTEQSENIRSSTTMQNHFNTSIVFVALVLAGILSALILLVIGRSRICKSNKVNGEDRVEVENGGSLYSVVGDHIARPTSSPIIASVVLYQDGQVDTGTTDNCKVGLPPNYIEVIYEDINTHESDLFVTGGYEDIKHYASTELSKPNGDILHTKGLNPNLTQQEQSKPKQTVGADGTIYTEVNKNQGSAGLYSSVKKQSQSVKFPKSTYAAIDHSVKTLPPPPKLPR